jgi:hypothetical protein
VLGIRGDIAPIGSTAWALGSALALHSMRTGSGAYGRRRI